MTNKAGEHQRLILEQFTKQAVPFSQMQNHSPERLLAAYRRRPLHGGRAEEAVVEVHGGAQAGDGGSDGSGRLERE